MSVTATVAVRLSRDGMVALDEPLRDQLDPELFERWQSLKALPATTPRQLLSHTSGIPNYFNEEAFFARVLDEPSRAWQPVELVDHVVERSTPLFPPGEGFSY
jgi:CubicO group peptidase (beta-lactamase class C family)